VSGESIFVSMSLRLIFFGGVWDGIKG